jgi:hypothetical protein
MTSALLHELVQVLRSTTELKGLDLWLMDGDQIVKIYTLSTALSIIPRITTTA